MAAVSPHDIQAMMQSILDGTPINDNIRRVLLKPRGGLNKVLEDFFYTAQTSHRIIDRMRQNVVVASRIGLSEKMQPFYFGLRTGYGVFQLGLEFVQMVDLLRRKDKTLNKKDAMRLLCIIIGFSALTITTFGLGGVPIIALGSALRGLSGAIQSVLRQKQNKERLTVIEKKLTTIRTQLSTLSANWQLLPDSSHAARLCQQYLRLKQQHTALEKIVNSRLQNGMERVLQAGNVVLLIGGIMCFFPATAPIGALLITLGIAAQALTGLVPIYEKLKSLKAKYDSEKEAPRPQVTPKLRP